jgi:hypothetical protein
METSFDLTLSCKTDTIRIATFNSQDFRAKSFGDKVEMRQIFRAGFRFNVVEQLEI